MHSISFESLNLKKPILRALAEEGYQQPTPIQQRAIPKVLAGADLLATAQTGTGKTAAFSLPILQLLDGRKGRGPIRVLVLTPTRELALQIDESFSNYGRHLPLRSAVVLGGVPIGAQIRALRQRPEVLVATPGRLLDLMGQGHARLDQIEILVLDEADRMLDMGFVRDVRRIVGELPKKRQTLFFSATLSKEIAHLAADMLHEPVMVEVTPAASVSEQIEQQVIFVDQGAKRELLAKVLRGEDVRRALVFTRTKRRANRVMKQLINEGIAADAIHANKNQGARQRALAAFDRGRIKVLVATDIVARGIDVESISHVINYDMPNDAESYVHRIGRTARAGKEGIALSFCAEDELSILQGVERLTGVPLTVVGKRDFRARLNGGASGARASGAAKKRRGPSDSATRRRGGNRRSATNGAPPPRLDAKPPKRVPVRQASPESVAQGGAERPQFGRRTRPALVGR
jgi:ATP-dependent RNA helicase RhlE